MFNKLYVDDDHTPAFAWSIKNQLEPRGKANAQEQRKNYIMGLHCNSMKAALAGRSKYKRVNLKVMQKCACCPLERGEMEWVRKFAEKLHSLHILSHTHTHTRNSYPRIRSAKPYARLG